MFLRCINDVGGGLFTESVSLLMLSTVDFSESDQKVALHETMLTVGAKGACHAMILSFMELCVCPYSMSFFSTISPPAMQTNSASARGTGCHIQFPCARGDEANLVVSK